MTTLISDTFDRANGALGTDWTVVTGTWAIAGNLATQSNGTGADYLTYWTTAVTQTDYRVTAILRTPGSGTPSWYPALIARWATGTGIGTCYILDVDTSSHPVIEKIVNGSWNPTGGGRTWTAQTISTVTVPVGNTTHTYGLEVSGTGATVTIKAYQDGVQIGTTMTDTDTDRITGAGNAGLYSYGPSTSGYDTFTVDNDNFAIADNRTGPGVGTSGAAGVFVGRPTQVATVASVVANTGLWTDENGSSADADLINAINAIDDHYLKSPLQPSNASIEFRFGTLNKPIDGDRILKTRQSKDSAGGTVDFTYNLRLYQAGGGGTLIQSFSGGSLSNVSATDSEVDSTETSAIGDTDWGNLTIEIVANQSA